MRTVTIRVKKPGFVRIVNPDPIKILDMAWRYGSYVLLKTGGVFHTLSDDGQRTLAMYHPPHAPFCPLDAPPNALVLHTLSDLRLLAEGQISYEEPFERPVPEWIHGGESPAAQARLGDSAGVPRSRIVLAIPPHTTRYHSVGGPYRERFEPELLNRLSKPCSIRHGGTMKVITFRGEPPCAHLKVCYRANPDYQGEQCEDGAWFRIPEREFLRMKEDARHLAESERLERADVARLLSSL